MSVENEHREPEVQRQGRARGAWRDAVAVGALAVLTLAVALAYALEPQGPRDLGDRVALWVNDEAYGANLRSGELLVGQADRARAAGADSLAEALERRAVRAFGRAAEAAAGPRDELVANDALADVYLSLGRSYLARGRGGRFGIGRDPEKLGMAEDIAACAVGLNPTQRRAELDVFLQALEEELERPLSGRCPR
jgi:hypothetical protein